MTTRALVFILALCGLAFSARAADRPAFGPPPDWVKSAQVDMTPQKSAAGAAVAVLLLESQVKFTAQTTTTYVDEVIKAQTPQGLQAIGTVTLQWQPDTDILTVHKLQIIRGGKVIDVLKTGPGFTTLRRESKLEEATLDGALTAVTQLEGLEVGDVLDLAYSLEQTDPILKGRVQDDFIMNLASVGHLRLRALWPTALGVQPQIADFAPSLHIQVHDGLTEASMALDDAPTLVPPKGAPMRFQRGREVAFSNFSSWADVSALLAPEFAAASQIQASSALDFEVEKIASQSRDAKVRAEAALTLVQDKVRYVLLALNGGGLKPASADVTWTRRFGDCKGKTALLLAMLHALKIEAEPVLVNTTTGDGLDAREPMIAAFDHVLVRATINGRVYWLDGARVGDSTLDAIVTPAYHWGLPIRSTGGALIRLEPQPLTRPERAVTIRMDASAGLTLPAPTHIDMILRGDKAIALTLQLSNITPTDLDRALKDFWTKQYDFIEVKSATAEFDKASGEERLSMDGAAKMDWSGTGYEADGASLGWKPDLVREAGPHKDAPYAVAFPVYEQTTETVVLPGKGARFSVVGKDVAETVAGYVFSRYAAIENGVFKMEASSRSLAPEFPASQAMEAAKTLTALSKSAVYVAPPTDRKNTEQENTAFMASEPGAAGEYVSRCNAYLNARRYDDAIADCDKAVAMDPTSSVAFADRSIAWALKGEKTKALADIDAALRVDPKEIVAFRAKGIIFIRSGQWSDAAAAFSEALQLDSRDLYSLQNRAFVYLQSKQPQQALADCDLGLSGDPDDIPLLQNKMSALIALKRPEDAVAVAARLAALKPDDAVVQLASARIFRQAHRRSEARAAVDRSLALKPSAGAFLERADLRDAADTDNAIADAEAAFKLDSGYQQAAVKLTNLYLRRKDYPAALEWLEHARLLDPTDAGLLASRGQIHLLAGQKPEASADFAAARKLGRNAQAFNTLCWAAATHDFELPSALSDCEAALKLSPKEANILDSYGFVLLRLGRNAEAIDEYDAALAVKPDLPDSLLGRSLAERRIGRIADADRDLKAAMLAAPRVVETFKGYGVTG